MNPVSHLRSIFCMYAQQLKALGHDTAKENFFSGPSPEESETLANALRNRATYPALLMEWPDNDVSDNNRTGNVEVLQLGFAVITSVSSRSSAIETEKAIYEVCKPIADQVLARLLRDSDRNALDSDCDRILLVRSSQGNWAAPFPELHGYRYDLQFRVFSNNFNFDPTHWDIPA